MIKKCVLFGVSRGANAFYTWAEPINGSPIQGAVGLPAPEQKKMGNPVKDCPHVVIRLSRRQCTEAVLDNNGVLVLHGQCPVPVHAESSESLFALLACTILSCTPRAPVYDGTDAVQCRTAL